MEWLDKQKFQKLSEQQESYIRMYHEYFVLGWDWFEITKYHNCSKGMVTTALKWVIANKLNIPAKYLVKGAVDQILMRLRSNRELYIQEVKKRKHRDNQFIIALNKEIREDEKEIHKLQEILKDDGDNANNGFNAAAVLSLLKENQKNA